MRGKEKGLEGGGHTENKYVVLLDELARHVISPSPSRLRVFTSIALHLNTLPPREKHMPCSSGHFLVILKRICEIFWDEKRPKDLTGQLHKNVGEESQKG